MKLTIELVPKTSWYNNLRSLVHVTAWNYIRRECYAKAKHVCEICGGVGDGWPVECHEIWNYDDDTHVQTLAGVIALCPKCHAAKHIGRTMNCGNLKETIDHIASVNQIDNIKVNAMIDAAMQVWQQRSQFKWTVDLSILQRILGHVPFVIDFQRK